MNSRLLSCSTILATQVRNHVRYPPHTIHIRFDPTDGRKIPCGDVLDRFKRLNNGLWIRGRPGRQTKVTFLKNHVQSNGY